MSARPLGALMVVLACVAWLSPRLAGAADDQVADVKGTITLNGKPLLGGRIILFPQPDDGQFVGAKIKEGAFKMSRVLVGRHIVTVEAKDVPPQFASEDTSSLTVEVKLGQNEFSFALKSN
jgi:hypothetical protein